MSLGLFKTLFTNGLSSAYAKFLIRQGLAVERMSRYAAFRSIPQYMVDAGHRAEIERMLVEVEIATGFARELRNKLIAHSDLGTVSGSQVVDSSSRMKIVDAIKSIIKPLRYVHSQFFDTHKLYHPITEGTNGFLRCVFLGVAKKNEELQLLKSGSGHDLLSKSLPDWMTSDRSNEFD